MRHGVLLGTGCLLALLSFPSVAQAQSETAPAPKVIPNVDPTPADVAARSERMSSTLGRLAQAYYWSGVKTGAQLTIGTVFVGLAGYFAFSKNVTQGTGSSRGAAVILSMMTGSAYLGRGLYALTGTTTTHETRLARFQLRHRDGPLTAADLAPFEAELALEAELGRNARHWEAATSLGVAAGGATLFAFGASSELRKSAREIVYIEGGVMLLSGAGLGIYSLVHESASEAEWHNYRAGGDLREASGASFRIAPVVSPKLAALSIIGQF